MARKRRRTRKRTAARRAPARRRRLRKSRIVRVRRRTRAGTRTVKRRSYRRNAGFVKAAMRGLTDAAQVTAGKIGFNALQRNLPLPIPIGGIAGDALKGLIVAGLGSFAASRFLRGDMQRNAITGLYQGMLESLIRGAGVPVVSGLLGEYDASVNAMNGLGSYPKAAAALPPAMGSYPSAVFEGEQYAYGA